MFQITYLGLVELSRLDPNLEYLNISIAKDRLTDSVGLNVKQTL